MAFIHLSAQEQACLESVSHDLARQTTRELFAVLLQAIFEKIKHEKYGPDAFTEALDMAVSLSQGIQNSFAVYIGKKFSLHEPDDYLPTESNFQKTMGIPYAEADGDKRKIFHVMIMGNHSLYELRQRLIATNYLGAEWANQKGMPFDSSRPVSVGIMLALAQQRQSIQKSLSELNMEIESALPMVVAKRPASSPQPAKPRDKKYN